MPAQPAPEELIVVPLYPHYAMASTKTVEVAVEAALAGSGIKHRFVGPFFDDPAYLEALADRARATIPAGTQYVLFSYHGIPERHLRDHPAARKIGFGIDLQRILACLHSLLQKSDRLVCAYPLALYDQRVAETALRPGPGLWKIGFRIDLQRTPVPLHRLLQKSSRLVLVSDCCCALLGKRIAETHLRRGPGLRKINLGKDLERTPVRLHRLFHKNSRPASDCTSPLLLQRVAKLQLRSGSGLRKISLGKGLKRTPVRLHRLLQKSSRLFAASPHSLLGQHDGEIHLVKRGAP